MSTTQNTYPFNLNGRNKMEALVSKQKRNIDLPSIKDMAICAVIASCLVYIVAFHSPAMPPSKGQITDCAASTTSICID